MALIVADTDVLIDFLRGRGANLAVRRALADGSLATTTVSRFELLCGAVAPEEEARVLELVRLLVALPLDTAGADRAATVRRGLSRRGHGIGMADSLIAGIVLSRGAELLTRNRAHFSRVEGLRLASLRP